MHLACTKWNVKENLRKASCLLSTIRQITNDISFNIWSVSPRQQWDEMYCTGNADCYSSLLKSLKSRWSHKLIKSVWDKTVTCSQDEQTVFSH